MCLTKKIPLVFSLLTLLVCGCTHHIGYSLEESDRWKGPAISGVVCVQPITDHANLSITNCQVRFDKKTWMTNFRKGYNNTNLTAAVTAMMVKHLTYSGLFTKVVSGTNADADYYLSGTLTDYEARGLPNKAGEGILMGTAFLGGLGGAFIGSISTAGMKSDYESTVKLTDLNLADKNGQSLWHDSICISTNFSAYFGNADPVDLCSTPDGFLKNAVSEMIYRLGNSPLTNRVSVESH